MLHTLLSSTASATLAGTNMSPESSPVSMPDARIGKLSKNTVLFLGIPLIFCVLFITWQGFTLCFGLDMSGKRRYSSVLSSRTKPESWERSGPENANASIGVLGVRNTTRILDGAERLALANTINEYFIRPQLKMKKKIRDLGVGQLDDGSNTGFSTPDGTIIPQQVASVDATDPTGDILSIGFEPFIDGPSGDPSSTSGPHLQPRVIPPITYMQSRYIPKPGEAGPSNWAKSKALPVKTSKTSGAGR